MQNIGFAQFEIMILGEEIGHTDTAEAQEAPALMGRGPFNDGGGFAHGHAPVQPASAAKMPERCAKEKGQTEVCPKSCRDIVQLRS